jgi:hypothetical protein
MASSGPSAWVQHQFQTSVIQGAPSLSQTNEISLGAKPEMLRGGFMFCQPTVANVTFVKFAYVDERFHAMG